MSSSDSAAARFSVTVAIALGSNTHSTVGPPRVTLHWAIQRLGEFLEAATASPLYHTEPAHVADQPWYFNQILVGTTTIGPHRLLERFHALEHAAGRDRGEEIRFGPRGLDIDLLTYGDLIISSSDLRVPHPRMHQRAFVLDPLHAVLPDAIDPRNGRRWSSYRQAIPNAKDATALSL